MAAIVARRSAVLGGIALVAFFRRQFGGGPVPYILSFVLATASTAGVLYLIYGAQPERAIVQRIEQLLPQDPCIGSLQRWARLYYYGRDQAIVRVTLKQAGQFGYRAGWRILPQGGESILDDRPMRYASADYDPATDRLTVRFCGPNT